MFGKEIEDFGDYSIFRSEDGTYWACKNTGMHGSTKVVNFLYGCDSLKKCEEWLFSNI